MSEFRTGEILLETTLTAQYYGGREEQDFLLYAAFQFKSEPLSTRFQPVPITNLTILGFNIVYKDRIEDAKPQRVAIPVGAFTDAMMEHFEAHILLTFKAMKEEYNDD